MEFITITINDQKDPQQSDTDSLKSNHSSLTIDHSSYNLETTTNISNISNITKTNTESSTSEQAIDIENVLHSVESKFEEDENNYYQSVNDQMNGQLQQFASPMILKLFGIYEFFIDLTLLVFLGEECTSASISVLWFLFLGVVFAPVIIMFIAVKTNKIAKARQCICLLGLVLLGALTQFECLLGEQNVRAIKAMYLIVRIVAMCIILTLEYTSKVQTKKSNE